MITGVPSGTRSDANRRCRRAFGGRGYNPIGSPAAPPARCFRRGGSRSKRPSASIYLPAEVDHHNAEEMKRKADKLIDRNHIKYVIFDFENTDFMDSSGIGVIMGRYKTISLIGGEVWAVHTNARIRKILTLSGVTKIMQIYEEEEE